MSEAAVSEFNVVSRTGVASPGLHRLRAFLSTRIAGSSRRSVAAWILGDFAVAQCAAVLALSGVLLWMLDTGRATAPGTLGASALRLYLRVVIPLSLMALVLQFLNRCYAEAALRNRRQIALNVLRAGLATAALYALTAFAGGGSGGAEAYGAAAGIGLAFVGMVGTRWCKSWLESPHTVESIPRHARAARPEEPPVLVIGGAGYIGSVLVRRLIAAGKRVRVLDSLVYGSGALRTVLGHPNLEFMVGDCRNIKNVVSAVKGVDSVIHLAAIVGDPACEQERQTALETNYAATRMLIEVAKGAKVRRFVFASTCSVYGASDEIMDETSQVRPISHYAHTKVQSERALLEARSDSFQPIILRLSTVFGHSYRPRFDLVVNVLTAKACREGVITIFNGQQWRPFIHVRDVADGMLMVLDTPLSVVGGEILNLGDSRMNYTLAQVAEKIAGIFPATRVEEVENSDRRNYRVSFDKLWRLTGFQTSVTLEAGIQEMRNALESRQVEDYKLALYNNQCFLQTVGNPRQTNEVDAYVMAAFSRHFYSMAELDAKRA